MYSWWQRHLRYDEFAVTRTATKFTRTVHDNIKFSWCLPSFLLEITQFCSFASSASATTRLKRLYFQTFRMVHNSSHQGRTQGGDGVNPPLELDILQKLYNLRKSD